MQYSNDTSKFGTAPPEYNYNPGQPVTQQPFGQTSTGFGQPEPPPGAPQFQPRPIITPQHFLPYNTKCPHCSAQVQTETKYNVGCTTVLWCFILGVSGLVAGCCLLPFFMNMCKDVTHFCPQCHQEVASYKRSETTPRSRAMVVHHYR